MTRLQLPCPALQQPSPLPHAASQTHRVTNHEQPGPRGRDAGGVLPRKQHRNEHASDLILSQLAPAARGGGVARLAEGRQQVRLTGVVLGICAPRLDHASKQLRQLCAGPAIPCGLSRRLSRKEQGLGL